MHLLALHEHGSSNPLGVSGNTDRLPFHPYFVFKDLVTIFVFLLALSAFVFYMPNSLGHSDNYIPANPMQTPPSIKYFEQFCYFILTFSIFFLIPPYFINRQSKSSSAIKVSAKTGLIAGGSKVIVTKKHA